MTSRRPRSMRDAAREGSPASADPGLGLELRRRNLSLPLWLVAESPALITCGLSACPSGRICPRVCSGRNPRTSCPGAWEPQTSLVMVKNSIPNGWRTVMLIGYPLLGTLFIAFKVPLKGAVNQRLIPT
ncbi:uncharacterized protein LOC144244980 [Crocuta crocuta]